MKFGLTEKAIEQIASVFKKHPELTQIQIFGSRAMGNYKPYSDIDMALSKPLSY